MKIFGLTFLALLIIAASGVLYLKYRFTHTPDQHDLAAQIDEEVKKYPAHGLVVGVYKNGKTYIKGYGKIKESQTVPNGATVFQIASVSKLFTASTLQILCDEGVVNMDSTLNELIGDTYPLSPKVQQITLKQLATHTSGLPRVPKPLMQQLSSKMSDEEVMKNPYSHLGSESMFDYLKTAEDTGKSGRFEYSNYGMGLLGHILELKTKQPFEALVEQKIIITVGHEQYRHYAHAINASAARARLYRG
ncbi:MAG TPA: serine hydrolase [Methylophilaceae bacterium]|nr:serine hydrolase [Methylophilaceae bacterium]HQC30000.1 serine hydrolase [Methylotenera sp.]